MSTMLPGGGVVIPSFRPDGQTKETITGTDLGNNSATSLAGQKWDSDSWFNNVVERANNGDEASIQFLLNYFANRESEKTARDWTAMREDNAYQRLSEDLRKAGISPYVLSGATPAVSSSAGKSYSGSDLVSQQSNKKTNDTNQLRTLLALFGIIMTATLHAMI